MIGELIKEALYTLRTNLLRTILTMIGIVLGVGSVVAIMTLGKSAYATAQSFLDDSGLGNIMIMQKGFNEQALPMNNLMIAQLKAADIDGVESYIPKIYGGAAEAKNSWDDEITMMYDYAMPNEISKEKYLAGEPFGEDEILAKANVIIIDNITAEKLYGSPEAAIGERLIIEQSSYKVIGVYKSKNPFSSESGEAKLPFSIGELDSFFQTYGYYNINVKVTPGADYEQVTENIKKALMEIYSFNDEDELTFSVNNVKAEMAQISMFMTAFSIGLSLIAAISLVVGGVGIMNIMLVSVTERTKEIGLMKALGAQEKDITFQFLVESVVMTVCGGMIGVIGGVGFSWLLITGANFLGEGTLPHFIYQTDFNAIWVSMAVSIVIGLTFGAYPAQKAAKLDPVVALRRD